MAGARAMKLSHFAVSYAASLLLFVGADQGPTWRVIAMRFVAIILLLQSGEAVKA